jgi:hypothetical protein
VNVRGRQAGSRQAGRQTNKTDRQMRQTDKQDSTAQTDRQTDSIDSIDRQTDRHEKLYMPSGWSR